MSGSGEVVTYRELDERSNRVAQLLWSTGLRPGDHVASFLENDVRYLEIAWAALRSGLYLTPINRYLTAAEAGYIIDDCGARALFTSSALADVATEVMAAAPNLELGLMVNGTAAGFDSYEACVEQFPIDPLDDEPRGEFMFYSSGTTGRPKGIKRPLSGLQVGDLDATTLAAFCEPFRISDSSVYLSPAPMYHAVPLAFSTAIQARGATVVVMERFDALAGLRAIERHRVTHSQWVPTMFVRMLRLPEHERLAVDLTSHEVAIHAAAPCPIWVKERMIEWWGPILYEYYGASEGHGSTFITSEEWLGHKGSVGRADYGTVHICADDGTELPVGETGLVYFELPLMPFEYHNDPGRTKEAQHPTHPNWSSVGDIGFLDDDCYLYLTDRKQFTIVSGGVNIYPQEIEDLLISDHRVADAAVIGVPNDEFGEEVKAVIEVAPSSDFDLETLGDELIALCRAKLAAYKVPRSVDIVDALPRLPTGKLYKGLLREQYWAGKNSRLV